jgi:hypothetical protein
LGPKIYLFNCDVICKKSWTNTIKGGGCWVIDC